MKNYLISSETKDKLISLINSRDDGNFGYKSGSGTRQICHVYVTGYSEETGWYTCNPAYYDTSLDSWNLYADSFCLDANNNPLKTGRFYVALRTGDIDGVANFITDTSFSLSCLAGDGLTYEEGSTCDTLKVNVGCGLEIVDNAVTVNLEEIAGNGLVIEDDSGDCNRLGVDVGCGLEIVDNKITINLEEIAGNGLVIEGDSNCSRLSIDTDVINNSYTYQTQIVENICPIYEDHPSIWADDSFGGDVSGTFNNLSVIKLRGRGISSSTPTTGQALVWDGTNWTPTNINGVPVGSVCAFINTVPSDWLELIGGTANRTTDANLFAYVGTLYGAGDGSTTFGMPDVRGRGIIGAGTGTGLTARTLGALIGAENHALSISEMPPHTHDLQFPQGQVGANYGYYDTATSGSSGWYGTQSKGGGQSHNNMQPSIVFRWAVKR